MTTLRKVSPPFEEEFLLNLSGFELHLICRALEDHRFVKPWNRDSRSRLLTLIKDTSEQYNINAPR